MTSLWTSYSSSPSSQRYGCRHFYNNRNYIYIRTYLMNTSLAFVWLQYIGYEVVLKQEMKDFEQNHGYPEGKTHYARWDIREEHPINIGRNLFGVASCMAFFKIIFQFEIHYKFGPILFCIKQVDQMFSLNALKNLSTS